MVNDSCLMVKFRHYIFIFLAVLPINSFAKNPKKSSMPAVLKADSVDGDRQKNVIDATGNVELTKDGNTLFADKLSYDKDAGKIDAIGNIRIHNYEMDSNVYAKTANVKSDFSSGTFKDTTLVFKDGSYIKSPTVTKDNEFQTTLSHPIFSICPNKDIEDDNSKVGENRDAIAIVSQKTVIDKKNEIITNKHSVIELYNVPVFYIPYLRMPTPAGQRKSGFLHPSYINTSKLGVGFKVPYYYNIAPNKDLTTTIQYHPGEGHTILSNNYRHLLETGYYFVNLDIANNRPKNNNFNTSTGVTNQEVRWYLVSKGDINLSDKNGFNFDIDNVGDKNYLRDYQNNFIGYKVSQATLDHIDNKNYASISAVRIQELELGHDTTTSPNALPILNYYKEFKPYTGKISPTYGILLNSTTISRDNGLQYRRFSAKPEIKIPYNLSGNLFEAGASLQGDYYNLDNNYAGNTPNNFDHNTFNARPEAHLKWSLPMVGKYKTNTVVIEPLINIATSSFTNNFNQIPNEDSQSIELTQSNLFLTDRFSGFDRNENGHRVTYGAKSSFFNDSFGQFNFGLGQSWRKAGKVQDVQLRGFNDSNKSNIVGEIGYKSLKSFAITYSFQLNESNYRNDINEITTSLNLDRFDFNANYIIQRKTVNNSESRKQLNFQSKFNLTKKFSFNIFNTRDLILDRNITRKYGLMYTGCCVTYGIFLSEENPIAIAKPQKSVSFNFSIKNL